MHVQPWILCPNLITPLHQIITDPKQVSDPLNYETIVFWVGYIKFISTAAADLEYFSVCIHLKNEMLQLFFLYITTIALSILYETKPAEEGKWKRRFFGCTAILRDSQFAW